MRERARSSVLNGGGARALACVIRSKLVSVVADSAVGDEDFPDLSSYDYMVGQRRR
jgi:hypothetical protein